MSESAASLSALLGHQFADARLLEAALTHPSAGEADARHAYERQEFLGDRVLALCISELLLERFPEENEGLLSRRLVALVRAEALADVAAAMGLEPHIAVAAVSGPANERGRTSLLADACEAVIGALFLDGGLEPARAFVRRHWADAVAATSAKPPRDPKTALQEWLQGRGHALPAYEVLSRDGPAHAPKFVIRVSTDDGRSAEAAGASKRQAEQSAADRLLVALEAADE